MATVRLKQNLIFGGAFHWRDSVIEEEKLPAQFRNTEFVKKPPGLAEEADMEEVPLDDEDLTTTEDDA